MDKMTGPEFLAYVKREFRRTDKDTELYESMTDTLIDMRIRFGFDEFKTEAYTSDGIDSVGDYRLDLPSDFGHFISARVLDNTDSWPLVKLGKESFDDKYPNPNADDVVTAKPEYCCLYNKQLLLGDVPDKTTYLYEISYTTESAEEIDADTDEVDFTDKYRATLRAGVLMNAYLVMGNDEAAIRWRVQYEEGKDKIIANDLDNEDGVEQQAYCGI